MIPLIVGRPELDLLTDWVRVEVAKVIAESGTSIDYLVGTMIETPRAALVAGEIAHTAEFFSFGTNDLTQMALGFSRDDVESRIVPAYIELKLMKISPFESIDRDGVGRLMQWAVAEGRAVRPDLKLGICGEHGGEPASVQFCHEIGLNYVSCSPYRIPIARLAAAHAALGSGGPATTA
jgi:pyruvate,orthophosphate dikinase